MHIVYRNNFFYGISQGWVLGPLIFNTFLCDLVIKGIERFSEVLFKWLDFNYIKINSGKIHILFPRNDNVNANIDDNTIISENNNELLGITLDSKPFLKIA